MKVVDVLGVPCAIANNGPENDMFAGFGPDNCTLCPWSKASASCGAACNKHQQEYGGSPGPYVELKYVPIMQMRGVKFHE